MAPIIIRLHSANGVESIRPPTSQQTARSKCKWAHYSIYSLFFWPAQITLFSCSDGPRKLGTIAGSDDVTVFLINRDATCKHSHARLNLGVDQRSGCQLTNSHFGYAYRRGGWRGGEVYITPVITHRRPWSTGLLSNEGRRHPNHTLTLNTSVYDSGEE